MKSILFLQNFARFYLYNMHYASVLNCKITLQLFESGPLFLAGWKRVEGREGIPCLRVQGPYQRDARWGKFSKFMQQCIAIHCWFLPLMRRRRVLVECESGTVPSSWNLQEDLNPASRSVYLQLIFVGYSLAPYRGSAQLLQLGLVWSFPQNLLLR